MTAAHLLLSAVYVLFAALSHVLAVIDVRTHRLPDAIVLPAYPVAIALLAAACAVGGDWSRWMTAILGGAALFAGYLAIRIVSPGGMGGGDVKLAGVVGLLLGWWGWSTLAVGALLGFVLGGVWGLALVALRRADRRTRIPFGPFMLAGAWCAIVPAALAALPLSTSP